MSDNRFKRSFRDRVPLDSGEICEWKNHFHNVLREVIGYLESQATKNPERFVFAYVTTITKGCNQYRRGKKPYSLRAIEYALAYLQELGVIARVSQKEFKGRIQHGFIVAPHDLCCCLIYPDGRVKLAYEGNTGRDADDCHCHYYSPALKGFNWDRSGVTVGKVNFKTIQLFGRNCSAENNS